MSQEANASQLKKQVYIIENLDCANCAANVERKLNAMPEIAEAVLTFATKQLRITAEDPDALLDKIRQTASAVEPGVEIYPRTRSKRNTAEHPGAGTHKHEHHHSDSCGHEHAQEHEHHHHGDSCGCGHEHTQEHEHHHHGDSCGCGHEHTQEHEHHHQIGRAHV